LSPVVYHQQYITCSLPLAVHHLQFITCSISPAVHHLQFITCSKSPAVYHLQFITCSKSPAVYHLQFTTCSTSPAVYHLQYITCSLSLAVERPWLSGESGSSHNLKVGGSIPTLTTHKIDGLTAGGVAVHLLVTAEVPLSKALYPHAPRAL